MGSLYKAIFSVLLPLHDFSKVLNRLNLSSLVDRRVELNFSLLQKLIEGNN